MHYSTRARRAKKELAVLREFVGNLTCVRAQGKVNKRIRALELQLIRK